MTKESVVVVLGGIEKEFGLRFDRPGELYGVRKVSGKNAWKVIFRSTTAGSNEFLAEIAYGGGVRGHRMTAAQTSRLHEALRRHFPVVICKGGMADWFAEFVVGFE